MVKAGKLPNRYMLKAAKLVAFTAFEPLKLPVASAKNAPPEIRRINGFKYNLVK